MFHNPKAPYSTSNTFTNFTPNFHTRPYILAHAVPTFFASAPPRGMNEPIGIYFPQRQASRFLCGRLEKVGTRIYIHHDWVDHN